MENKITSQAIALQYNECINKRDLVGLLELMTENYTLIDTENNYTYGKEKCKKNWSDFFEYFPDYLNIFEKVIERGTTVIMQGYSICSDKRLNLAAIWVAKIKDNKVRQWRIYLDTKESRAKVGI